MPVYLLIFVYILKCIHRESARVRVRVSKRGLFSVRSGSRALLGGSFVEVGLFWVALLCARFDQIQYAQG